MIPGALVFDFNGTLSDDEQLLCAIFVDLFAEHGKPLEAEEYFGRLVGFSDQEIVRAWLGPEHPDIDAVVAKRIARYRAAVADGSTVHEHVREAVRYAAGHVPLAVCSGAARAELEPVLEAAGIVSCFTAIVTADDVVDGKPHPEGYLEAVRLLGVTAGAAAAFEDTEAGVASARAAGIGTVYALTTTLDPARLGAADELVDRLDLSLLRRCLS